MRYDASQLCSRRSVLLLVSASVLISLLFENVSIAEENESQPSIGELVVRKIPAKHYLRGEFETEFKSMGKPVGKTLTEMMEAAREKKVGLHGPVIHFYHDAPHQDPEKRFRMETGFFVPVGTPAVGTFETRELPELRCATILYVGPATRIGDAWQKLYRNARAMGLTPNGEERELYLYWEGVESPNNIVQVQVGID